MPGTPPIVDEELQLLADILARLENAPPRVFASEEEAIAEIQRIQFDIATAKTEDKAALEQQYEYLTRLLDQLRKGRDVEAVDPSTPYFGHIRIATEGRVSDIQLGRATHLTDGLRIIDWRHAPISRLYYRYAEGDEYEEDIGPRVVSGTLTLRRTVSIQAGRLERVSAPQGTFVRRPEGWKQLAATPPRLAGAAAPTRSAPAQQKIGSGSAHRADKHLPDIAALIDPDQFELISRTNSGPVVIRGGAGSGKTTVALHRIAWLAYQDPRKFHPSKMMVVVWGRALRDYVSKVLPSLGVGGVSVVTWGDWSRQLVARHFPALPGHNNANTPSSVVHIKTHPGLPALLEEVVAGRAGPTNGPSAVEDWKQLLTNPTLLSRLPGVTPEEIQTLMAWSRSQQAQLSLHEEHDKSAQPWLDEEDDPILLRAWQLRVGPMRAKGGGQVRYSHIAVDEVQDFSPMEIGVLLGATDVSKCITLAGDTQQHISAAGGSQRWGDLLLGLGVSATSLSTLRVSYRSTSAITAFARLVLGSQAEDESAPLTMRDGPAVELFDFAEHGECVEFLGTALRDLMKAEPLASVALISRDAATARLYFAGLDAMDIGRLRLVEEQVFAFAPGIDVVDVAQVKGLEFDYVVVLDASTRGWPDRAHDRRLLHVAATRAVHQLWITAVGTPSPIVLG